MRLQHVTVMFVLIFIPIILVTSYFINLQVKTIKLETSYNEKLINATYDAMTAFELNTANEDLSTVSDSLRSIIDASNNIFFNTLCTNFGISNASKSYIQPYIPAILYTLYDGYYIYAPTNIPEICVDDFGRTIRTSDYGVTGGNTTVSGDIGIYQFDKSSIVYSKYNPTEPAPETTTDPNENTQSAPKINYGDLANKEEYGQILYKNNDGTYSTQLHTIPTNYNQSTYYKRDYILKSYIPYSAKYCSPNSVTDLSKKYNITINYTLDNFMTIEGYIGDIYYTKSGYFIDKYLIKSIVVDGDEMVPNGTDNPLLIYSDDKINELIHDPENHEVTVTLSDGTVISNYDGTVTISSASGVGTETRYWEDAISAVEYYVDSYLFSNWIYENLSGITESNLQTTQYSVLDIQKSLASASNITDSQSKLLQKMLYDFKDNPSTPFVPSNPDPTANFKNDPESQESIFYKHKRNVIKNSITYNLILSMLVYTEESRTTEFNMPVFSEVDWDRVLNNVSITAFMEGMRCGLKYYNNYAIVTSTNNEISVTDNEIYYVPRANRKDASGHWILNVIDDKEYVQKDDAVIQTAHRIDCPNLELNGNGAISFKSKEIKYDKILKKVDDGYTNSYEYVYDHMAYTDYDCIVDSNYTVTGPITGTTLDGNTDVLTYLLENKDDTSIADKLKSYRIAIAKERNNLYKTTAFPENYGWRVKIVNSEKKSGDNDIAIYIADSPNRDIRKIKKIEVTIEDVGIKDASGNNVYGVYTDSIEAKLCGDNFTVGKTYSEKQTVSTTSTSRRTIEFVQDFDGSGSNSASDFNVLSLNLTTGDKRTVFKVDAVKIYYK